ncbi:ABC transporter ATP-binding protein [Methanonatronarchaeum sp. AMET-Sl]|uniref:ABC transporter ATP-binding protein n=1 Tax=Methanonatronarchaeum sp. AMET-Sl TaxID=3037654 RepID=UPI00244E2D13|nr:ABC transporter ATP-binding protein [Methanonatronarchaeum sp. AMET-Sl]WGI17178.1 ABC transporter ATP-binding protein [Methanonatronarchaeum sp. AMET-Sl]
MNQVNIQKQLAVTADNLRKTYYLGEPVHALDGVSLELPKGSYTAVMGPSGSGKSTLLNVLGCLDTPDSGELIIDGEDISKTNSKQRSKIRSKNIGFVFQTFNLMPRLTAAENITLPTQFTKNPLKTNDKKIKKLLKTVGLETRADHRPNQLSGGQRQRVAIARALINDPTLILADEPTGNLDTTTGNSIMNLFKELHKEGRTILLVTHEKEIAEHAERTIHMVDGKIESIEVKGEAK